MTPEQHGGKIVAKILCVPLLFISIFAAHGVHTASIEAWEHHSSFDFAFTGLFACFFLFIWACIVMLWIEGFPGEGNGEDKP